MNNLAFLNSKNLHTYKGLIIADASMVWKFEKWGDFGSRIAGLGSAHQNPIQNPRKSMYTHPKENSLYNNKSLQSRPIEEGWRRHHTRKPSKEIQKYIGEEGGPEQEAVRS